MSNNLKGYFLVGGTIHDAPSSGIDDKELCQFLVLQRNANPRHIFKLPTKKNV
jgi:hypothetical protein